MGPSAISITVSASVSVSVSVSTVTLTDRPFRPVRGSTSRFPVARIC
jgi:hypothetical protein